MATTNVINGTLAVLKTGTDHATATAFAFSTSASIYLWIQEIFQTNLRQVGENY